MAKSRRRRRTTKAVVRYVRKGVARRRRRAGKSSFMGSLIPEQSQLMYGGLGGGAYPFAKGLIGKFLPNLNGGIMGGLAAFAVHFVGNNFVGNRDVGTGAIGALACDLVWNSGILSTVGLGDYFHDYFHDPIELPAGPGRQIQLPEMGRVPGVNDIGRGAHHRRHHFAGMTDGGYGSHYGA